MDRHESRIQFNRNGCTKSNRRTPRRWPKSRRPRSAATPRSELAAVTERLAAAEAALTQHKEICRPSSEALRRSGR
jgi:hypothetical protein